jgi:carbon storage regulator CsrA
MMPKSGGLVLSRKREEVIVIGNDTYVKVIDIGLGKVKLLVQAPPGVAVDRLEVRQMKLDSQAA